jgi:hypothetical protein
MLASMLLLALMLLASIMQIDRMLTPWWIIARTLLLLASMLLATSIRMRLSLASIFGHSDNWLDGDYHLFLRTTSWPTEDQR